MLQELATRYQYSPFGMASVLKGATLANINPYEYTGRRYDPESGLMYYRSRYYDPAQRRFVQEDRWRGILPIPGTYVNKYHYVGNNPINKIDPLGMRDDYPTTFGELEENVHEWIDDFFDSTAPDTPFMDGLRAQWDVRKQMKDFRNLNGKGDFWLDNADKYFHCKAHCEASEHGKAGQMSSYFAGGIVEAIDYINIFKGSFLNYDDCADDMAANKEGREGPDPFPFLGCEYKCKDYCLGCYAFDLINF